MTSDLAIIYVLAAVTLLSVVAVGVWQLRQVQVAKARRERSVLAQRRADQRRVEH
jgi:hypothetical protein